MKNAPIIDFHRTIALCSVTVAQDMRGTLAIEACPEGLRLTLVTTIPNITGIETSEIVLGHHLLATELLPAVAKLDELAKRKPAPPTPPPAEQKWREQ